MFNVFPVSNGCHLYTGHELWGYSSSEILGISRVIDGASLLIFDQVESLLDDGALIIRKLLAEEEVVRAGIQDRLLKLVAHALGSENSMLYVADSNLSTLVGLRGSCGARGFWGLCIDVYSNDDRGECDTCDITFACCGISFSPIAWRTQSSFVWGTRLAW